MIVCPYCRSQFEDASPRVFCDRCGTAHHENCWLQYGHCSVFGCQGRQRTRSYLFVLPALLLTASLLHPAVAASLSSVLLPAFISSAALALFFLQAILRRGLIEGSLRPVEWRRYVMHLVLNAIPLSFAIVRLLVKT